MGTPVETPPSSAKERLLDAADRLMYERGFHGVGVAELCEAADVRPGSFYYYFRSKQALAAEMLERAWVRTDQRIFAPAFDGATSTFEAIDVYAEALEQNMRTHEERSGGIVAGCRFGNFAIESAPHDPVLAEATATALAAMTDRFRRLIDEGRHRGEVTADADADTLAELLVAQMEGLMVLAKANHDPSAIRRLGAAARLLLTN